MKRAILSLLLAVLMLPGFSQSLSLENDDGPVADGSTVWIWGDLSNFIVSHIEVTNNSASAMNVICVREEISVVGGSTNYFCWDQCFDPSTDTSGVLTINAGETNENNFSGDYTAGGNPGTSTIKYTFYDASNPTDRVSFNVEYYGSPASVVDAKAPTLDISKAYPNPASGQFSFDYVIPQNSSSVRLVVRDILGGTVRDLAFNPGQGTLTVPTEGMKEGIYFYSILVGNEVTQTRKLVIR